MAIYHLSAKPVQRSCGKSAVAAAAYRSRSRLHDERQGMTFSYTGAADLVHSEIVGFSGPRSTLWNMAEAMEKRKDATTAREYEVALPHELSRPDQVELARSFAKWLNQEQGCVVDFSIHEGNIENPHVHILTTTRAIDGQGSMSDIKIPREWSDKKRKAHGLPSRKAELESVRARWAIEANSALEKAGIDERINHQSYARQGVDRLPTSHLGPAVFAMERDGIQTYSGDHNRMIMGINLVREFELDDLRNHKLKAKKLADQLADIDTKIRFIQKESAAKPRTEPTPDLEPESKTSNQTSSEIGAHGSAISSRAKKEPSSNRHSMASTFAEYFKSKLFTKTWNAEINPILIKSLKWVDIESRSITLKSGEQIIDRGDSVTLSKGSDDAIAMAISMARAKGWKSVSVRGSDDFQSRAAFALKEAQIEPKLNSEVAKKRFKDMAEKHPTKPDEPPAAEEPSSKKDPKLARAQELVAEPEPEIAVDNLKKQVRRACDQTPPPTTSPFKDDTRKLRQWSRDRLSELVVQKEPKGLEEIFIEEIERQALMAGYSRFEIEAVGLNNERAKTTSTQTPSPSIFKEARFGPSRIRSSIKGNTPAGT